MKIPNRVIAGAILAGIATVLLFAVPPATAQTLPKIWEATGFANPDSVLWDAERQVLYVSNVNGTPSDKDGNGYISKLSADGRVLARTWVSGLDGPKGMAVYKGRLYVADIDRLLVIDTATAKLIKSYLAPESKALDDVAVDDNGIVYVSDVVADSIWRLADGRFDKWLSDPRLTSPNGLKIERDRLVVATWGTSSADGTSGKTPGALKAVALDTRQIRDLTPPLGNLAGIEADGRGGYLVSDYVKGVVLRVDRAGKSRTILRLGPGSADIGIILDQHLLLVPMMMDGKVIAYRLP